MKTKSLSSFLALFLSTGTLVCCAIPALLVMLGFGAALASLVSAVPEIVWLSEHKGLVFGSAGVALLLAAMMQFRAKDVACPVDGDLGEACATTRDWSKPALIISTIIYLVGAFFAFGAPLFM